MLSTRFRNLIVNEEPGALGIYRINISCLYEQDTDSEMERLQRDINAILEQGENYARDVESKDPEKVTRVRKQMDALKVKARYCVIHIFYIVSLFYTITNNI